MPRMPRPEMASPVVAPRVIFELLTRYESFVKDEAGVRRQYPWASRFVMGLPLAPWQRKFTWDADRCSQFVAGIWRGVPLGQYIVASEDYLQTKESAGGLVFDYLSGCVIDGQQRLSALQMYFNDEIALEDADGQPCVWSQLGVVDKRWFCNRVFSRGEIQSIDESFLARYYDLHNYGGVQHEEGERAQQWLAERCGG